MSISSRVVRLSFEALESRLVLSDVRSAPIIPTITEPIRQNLQAIYERGQSFGRASDVFMKVGDSITNSAQSVPALGGGGFDPISSGLVEADPEVLDTWRAYRNPIQGGNSFTRSSLTARDGNRLSFLLPSLQSEISITSPAIAMIQIGTNDQAFEFTTYESSVRQVIQTCITQGIIPILTTIPRPLLYGTAGISRGETVNQIVFKLGTEYRIPVWNYWRAMESLPNFGIGDLVHPSFAPGGGGDLTSEGLQYGYNVRNLNTLQVLDAVREAVFPDEAIAEDRPWNSLLNNRDYVAVTSNQNSQVNVLDGNGRTITTFTASIGSRASIADMNNDSIPDVLIASGPGGDPLVQVRDGRSGDVIDQFYAFATSFRGGVHIATGDVDGDGQQDIILGTGMGGGPQIRVVNGADLSDMGSFFAFESTFRGGVELATGDLDGDGVDEIIIGAGNRGGPVMKIARANGEILSAFFALESTLRSGVFVGAGDIDRDGKDELLVTPGEAAPRVQVLRGLDHRPAFSFFADDPNTQFQGAQLVVLDKGNPQIFVTTGRMEKLKRWSLPNPTPLADVSLPIDLSGNLNLG